jgi:hypothetical protein
LGWDDHDRCVSVGQQFVHLVAENRVPVAASVGADDDGGGTVAAGGRGEADGRGARLDELGAPRTARQPTTGRGRVVAEYQSHLVDAGLVAGAIGSWWARARSDHAHHDDRYAGTGGPTKRRGSGHRAVKADDQRGDIDERGTD